MPARFYEDDIGVMATLSAQYHTSGSNSMAGNTGTSRLAMMQARLREQLMVEKESRLLEMAARQEAQRQGTIQRVTKSSASSLSSSLSSLGSSGGQGRVRKLFEERRNNGFNHSPVGWDKSYPLEPVRGGGHAGGGGGRPPVKPARGVVRNNRGVSVDRAKAAYDPAAMRRSAATPPPAQQQQQQQQQQQHQQRQLQQLRRPAVPPADAAAAAGAPARAPQVHLVAAGRQPELQRARRQRQQRLLQPRALARRVAVAVAVQRQPLRLPLARPVARPAPGAAPLADLQRPQGAAGRGGQQRLSGAAAAAPAPPRPAPATGAGPTAAPTTPTARPAAVARARKRRGEKLFTPSPRVNKSKSRGPPITHVAAYNGEDRLPKPAEKSSKPKPKLPPKPKWQSDYSDEGQAASQATTPRSKITASVPAGLAGCKICGRNFAPDRLEKHESICAKSQAKAKKRKVFDPVKMRTKGTEAETYVKRGAHLKDLQQPKKADWRKKHEDFIATVRAAKGIKGYEAPPMDTSDYVQCPHCGRKFSEGAAERHIPKCASIQSNKPAGGRRR
nr:translation initiation factor IF-2-like isoform X2 [Penaeus vannamei]